MVTVLIMVCSKIAPVTSPLSHTFRHEIHSAFVTFCCALPLQTQRHMCCLLASNTMVCLWKISAHHVCAGDEDPKSHISLPQSEEPALATSTSSADAAIQASASEMFCGDGAGHGVQQVCAGYESLISHLSSQHSVAPTVRTTPATGCLLSASDTTPDLMPIG